MSAPMLLLAVPLTIAVLGLFPKAAPWLPKATAAMMAGQVVLACALSIPAWLAHPAVAGAFGLDGIGAAFVLITTLVAAAAMIQAAILSPSGASHEPVSNRWLGLFYTFTGLFIASMYGVMLAQNLGYMWIALEATTLMSAPLVDFYRTKASLEASWKYLLLCSVGIAFAFLGTLFLFAAQHGMPSGATLSVSKLSALAPLLDQRLLHMGFALCVLGYGTKAGLFPLHSWLPDAHSEAPAPVSAMLSGALLNCAIVAIWRVSQVVAGAGRPEFVSRFLVPAGTITVLASSIMLVRQHDLKRMWAYSSVEHVGILTVAVGLGAAPLLVLHAFNHSVSKTALFLMSGNIQGAFETKSLSKISGILRFSPAWGVVILAGGLAIAGSPPFGTFISEFLILRNASVSGHPLAVAGLVAGVTIAFLAIFSHLVPAVLGSRRTSVKRAPAVWALGPAVLMLISLAAGIATPPEFATEPAIQVVSRK